MKPMVVLVGGLFVLGMGIVAGTVITNYEQKQFREIQKSLRSIQVDVSDLLQRVKKIENQGREHLPHPPYPYPHYDCPPPMNCQ